MGSEKNLYRYVKLAFCPFPGVHLTRIENRDTGPGVPDVHLLDNGVEVWLELKYREDQPKQGEAVFAHKGLRPSQVEWLNEHCRCGGTAWIVAQLGSSVFVVHGHYAPLFNGLMLSDLEVLASLIFNLKDAVGWVALRDLLQRSKHHGRN